MNLFAGQPLTRTKFGLPRVDPCHSFLLKATQTFFLGFFGIADARSLKGKEDRRGLGHKGANEGLFLKSFLPIKA